MARSAAAATATMRPWLKPPTGGYGRSNLLPTLWSCTALQLVVCMLSSELKGCQLASTFGHASLAPHMLVGAQGQTPIRIIKALAAVAVSKPWGGSHTNLFLLATVQCC